MCPTSVGRGVYSRASFTQTTGETVERQSDQDGGQTQLDGARWRGRQRSADDGHAQSGGGSPKTLQLLVLGRRRAGGPGRRRHGAHALGEEDFRGIILFFIFFN